MAKNLLSKLLLRLGQSGWMPLASCDLMREWEIPTIIMRKTKQISIDPAIKVSKQSSSRIDGDFHARRDPKITIVAKSVKMVRGS